ncbi:MAG: NAD(P)-dependent oxidoreductase [Bdellovibrionales bacterium]|nr:NAD(P)-dependent oxidoreductase [Bdellovibrionales bacterium]
MKRVLITGSAGFLGRTLVSDLKRYGHFVCGIDKNNESQSDLFYQHDLLNPFRADIPKFDLCIHLASCADGFLANATKDDIFMQEQAMLNTVLDICQRERIRRIVFASSINVFECGDAFPQGRLAALNQFSPYARAKAHCERVIEESFSDFVIVRPTNFFGKQQTRNLESAPGFAHVIPDLLLKIRSANSCIEVMGDGTQRRNFIHIQDVSNFFRRILESPKTGWFNIRSEIEISILELTKELLKFESKECEIKFLPNYMKFEPQMIKPFDIQALNELGWQAEVCSLIDGLNR